MRPHALGARRIWLHVDRQHRPTSAIANYSGTHEIGQKESEKAHDLAKFLKTPGDQEMRGAHPPVVSLLPQVSEDGQDLLLHLEKLNRTRAAAVA